MNDIKTELRQLYSDSSKHSMYQNIPDFVSAELGYAEAVNDNWRSDRPRFEYLTQHRQPAAGETWLDFGANTGFFVLSLAHRFPQTSFIAVEANPNHASFIQRIAGYFALCNIEVIQRTAGLRDLQALPRADFMLHLNVLHHAGHDFDTDLVPSRADFPNYAKLYLSALRTTTTAMLFQMGSNWGGDKSEPLVGTREDANKLETFGSWLRDSGWNRNTTAYPRRCEKDRIEYFTIDEIPGRYVKRDGKNPREWAFLDQFHGEFYRRPLFLCMPQVATRPR